MTHTTVALAQIHLLLALATNSKYIKTFSGVNIIGCLNLLRGKIMRSTPPQSLKAVKRETTAAAAAVASALLSIASAPVAYGNHWLVWLPVTGESSWTSLGMSPPSCVIKSAGTVSSHMNMQQLTQP